MDLVVGRGFREKCKRTEIALNIIQSNLVQKPHFPFIIVE